MKKSLLLTGIMVICVALSACNGVQLGQAASAQPVAEGTGAPGQRNMPEVMKLALGTFELEETGTPVTAEQAQKLLFLWKALRSLGESDTTAAAELQAVVKQIQETMTPEQLAAIEAMQLSYQDMQVVAQKFGLELGGGFGNQSPEMQATMQAARQSGQAPPGGFGGPPGGDPGGGGGFNRQAAQTAMAQNGGAPRSGLGISTALLDALIKFLEAKIK